MAILRELVEVLARITGVPESTVFAFGRFTREAGLISQKGRGRAAAEMSTLDAANLFIALGATDVTREAPLAVRKFSSLQGFTVGFPGSPLWEYFHAWLKPVILKTEANGGDVYLKDFGSFVQFLLEDSVSGRLTRFLRGIPVLDERSRTRLLLEEHEEFGRSLVHFLRKGATMKPTDQVVVGTEEDVWFTFVFKRANPFVYFDIKTRHVGEEDLFTVVFRDPDGQGVERDLQVEATLTQTSIQALGSTLRGFKIPSKLKRLEEIETFLFSNKDAA
jgi:hypothetical protein